MSLLDTASLICTPNGYKEGKLYSVIPSDGSGDMSVTRATTATRVNSAGLVELVPYNLNTNSENFITSWGNDGTSTTTNNFTTAPNGTMTAAKVVANVANGYAYKSLPVAVGTYTLSFYVKASAATTISIDFNDIGAGVFGQVFNLTTEWQRVSFTHNVTIGSNLFISYSGLQLGVDYYIWGAQLNEGTIKPYQKTETRLNIPRLDYSNGTCPSLLVEPQRTNLLTYSENLTQWYANAQIASTQLVSNPLTGVNNATKITKVTSSTDPWVRQIVSAGNGTYTYSVYLWTDAGQQTDIEIYMYNASISEVYTLSIALTTTPTRYEFDATFANTGGNITARIDLVNTGDQYIYAYGAQLEAGSYATSYIPTTSASVTRNADVISKTGISSLIGQTEGTLFVEGSAISTGSSSGLGDSVYLFAISDNTISNQISVRLYPFDGVYYIQVRSGGSAIAFTSYTPTSLGQNVKIAIGYKTNDFAFYVNGVQIATSSSGSVPALNSVNIGQFGGVLDGIGNIKAAALWKTRLTNTQLAQLTTI